MCGRELFNDDPLEGGLKWDLENFVLVLSAWAVLGASFGDRFRNSLGQSRIVGFYVSGREAK